MNRRLINYKGELMTIAEAAKRSGVPRRRLESRIWVQKLPESKWFEPKMPGGKHKKFLIINGERKSLIQLSKEYGISIKTLRHRLNKGWSSDEVITVPMWRMNLQNTKRGHTSVVDGIALWKIIMSSRYGADFQSKFRKQDRKQNRMKSYRECGKYYRQLIVENAMKAA